MSAAPTRFGVLINPTAGHGRGQMRGRQALAEMHARGLNVIDLSHPDPGAAFRSARDRRKEYDVLVTVGGDGMAHMGFNVVAGTDIPFGLIPVGSGNDFARHLRLPVHEVSRSIDVILEGLDSGVQPIDLVQLTPLNGEWNDGVYPSDRRWAGCVVSAGFDSMVNARANTYAWPRGVGRYVRGVLRELRTFEPYPYRITLDGGEETFRGALVAIANTPSFGGGMRIAPDAHVATGELEVVVAGEVTRSQLLRVFPKVFSGTHVTHPAVRIRRAREVTVGPDGDGVIPDIFADGEFVGAGPVRAQVVRGGAGMLCPRLEV